MRPADVARLGDIGVPPFLIASSVIAIMAERLIRVNCSKCKEPYKPPELELEAAGITAEEAAKATFLRGRGCNHCHQNGYRGRLGIFELLKMTTAIREMTFNREPTQQIRRVARRNQMRTLLEDGVQKALEELTLRRFSAFAIIAETREGKPLPLSLYRLRFKRPIRLACTGPTSSVVVRSLNDCDTHAGMIIIPSKVEYERRHRDDSDKYPRRIHHKYYHLSDKLNWS